MRILVLLAVILFATGCPGPECTNCSIGNGANGGTDGGVDGGAVQRTDRTVSWLSEGNFWLAAWSEIDIQKAFLGSPSGKFAVGSYSIKLGAPVKVGDLQMFELRLDGDTQKYTPRWSRIGANRYGDVYGLAAGSPTPVLLYSPELSTWPGSGFFTVFDAATSVPVDRNAQVVPSDYTNRKPYFDPPLVAIGTSSSQQYGGTGCTYFENYGTICGSDPGSGPTREEAHLEYWHPSAGPVAMHHSYNYQSCTGDCALNRWEKRVVVWFFGDVHEGNSALEDEPNVFATPTVIPVRTTLFNMLGGVNTSDALSGAPGGTYQAHDWYRFEMTTLKSADFYLYWGDTAQEFEMNLYTAPDSAWGFQYLATANVGTEPEFKKSLWLSGQYQPGKYLLGIRRKTSSEFWTGYGLMSIGG